MAAYTAYPPPSESPYPPPAGSPYPPPAGSPYSPPAGSPYPPPAGSPYPPPAESPYPPSIAPSYPPPNASDNGQLNPYPPPATSSYPDPVSAPVPSAPPLIGGYEHMPFGSAGGDGAPIFLPPPPMPMAPPPDTNHLFTFSDGNMTADQCREAFIKFADDNTCYGTKCAKDHVIVQILPSNILHYQLETFTETRSVAYVHVPYSGGPIDGPGLGPALGPWQIDVSPDSLFHDHVKKQPVPHTSSILKCFICDGRGLETCHSCKGSGNTVCSYCSHRPANSTIECTTCKDTRSVTCSTCSGSGKEKCKKCQGHKMLKLYIELTVNYVNHQSDYVHQVTALPNELVKGVSGITITELNEPQVWPITNYPVPEINTASIDLIGKHRTAYQAERQIRQRQKLRSIEVSEVQFTWKDHKCTYWVYGKEHKVHCPDYPQKCCCCTIM